MSATMDLLRTDWFGLLVAFLAGATALALTQPTFLSTFNIYVMLTAFSLSVLVALSQMVILAIGQLNLSVGAIGGLAAIAFAGTMEVWGLPIPLAMLIGVLIGIGCGALNGAVTHLTGLNAFVVTLATLSIFKGITIGITEAQPFYGIPDAVKAFGNARIGFFPYLLFVSGALLLGMLVFMRRAKLGRQLLAVGGNRSAAELSGIHIGKVVIAAHIISGTLAAVAGMLAVARLQLGQPTIGDDWLIESFAAPVIGGAVLAGGHVSVVGTVLGVAIITLINNALVLLNVDPFAVQLLLGALILAAVALSRFRDPP
ncbi:MAG: ABC transporter permease [Pseudomonadota bacterium]